MIARAWHGCIAVLVLFALVVQTWIAVDAAARPPGHAVGTLAGTALLGRLVRTISFFTIQSNVLSGIVAAQLAYRPGRDGMGWRVLRLDALFGITVTGIVYATVLAKVHEPRGWQQTSSNAVVHYVVPIMMVLGWVMFGPRPRIDARVLGRSLIWPLLYFGYTLVRGSITKWYPYPFVDVNTQGYGRVLINAVLVTLVLGAVAGLYLFGDRRLPKTS